MSNLKQVTEQAALADVIRGRDFARWIAAFTSTAAALIALAFVLVLWQVHLNAQFAHERADKQDAWRCHVAVQEDYPNPQRWCP